MKTSFHPCLHSLLAAAAVFGALTVRPAPLCAQDLYAASARANAVFRITPDGAVSIFNGGVSGSPGLACDAAGNLYAANFLANVIVQITPEGGSSVFADVTKGVNQPYGLACDAAGNLYVASSGNVIQKITPAGVLTTFASDGLLDTPEALAFDAAGNLYVGNGSAANSTTSAPARSSRSRGVTVV